MTDRRLGQSYMHYALAVTVKESRPDKPVSVVASWRIMRGSPQMIQLGEPRLMS